MSLHLRRAAGRCDAGGGALSVRNQLFGGATGNPLALRERLESPYLAGSTSVSDWLSTHPLIQQAIQWEHTSIFLLLPAVTNYAFWNEADQDALQALVNDYADCQEQSFPDPPPNLVSMEEEDDLRQEISFSAARQYFLATVAHTLTVEMGDWVPWSINDYDDTDLANLLDSRSFFSWRIGGNYEFVLSEHGCAVPTRPRRAFRFMYENDLIGPTPTATIGRLIDWCRWNLSHFGTVEDDSGNQIPGNYNVGSMEVHWQYHGFAPVRRVIEQTTTLYEGDTAHHTAGCYGTVGFMRDVLRSVNIPCRLLKRSAHALPHYMSINRYLSHGDDPYNQCAQRSDLPAEDLLLDGLTFNNWFGPHLSVEEHADNISRGVYEAIKDLPSDTPEVTDGCREALQELGYWD